MLNPGLLLERPLELKDGRSYFIVVNQPNRLRTYIAMYKEYSASWEIPSKKVFEPHWVLEGKLFERLAHNNYIVPYKLPNWEEYQNNVDHFLGF